MFSPFVSRVVKKYLQKGYCAVSEVKLDILFLLEITKWSDNFSHFERTTSRTALRLMGHV